MSDERVGLAIGLLRKGGITRSGAVLGHDIDARNERRRSAAEVRLPTVRFRTSGGRPCPAIAHFALEFPSRSDDVHGGLSAGTSDLEMTPSDPWTATDCRPFPALAIPCPGPARNRTATKRRVGHS